MPHHEKVAIRSGHYTLQNIVDTVSSQWSEEIEQGLTCGMNTLIVIHNSGWFCRVGRGMVGVGSVRAL